MTSLGQGPNVSDTQISSYVRVKLAIARNFHFQGGAPRSPPWSPQRPFLAILVVFSGYRGPDSKRRVPLRSASRASSFEYPHAILSRNFVFVPLFGPKKWSKTKISQKYCMWVFKTWVSRCWTQRYLPFSIWTPVAWENGQNSQKRGLRGPRRGPRGGTWKWKLLAIASLTLT